MTTAAVAGAVSLVLGIWFALDGKPAAYGFLVLGIFLVAIAGVADRLERLALKLFAVDLEAQLSKKEHGDEFIQAAKAAPDSALEAVLPLLRDDVASEVVEVGPAYAGKRLVDPELAWLRQELNVTVFAIQRPGDERWSGGGRVSTTPLPQGTKLALVGERSDVEVAADRLRG
jgi:hypothetical protein